MIVRMTAVVVFIAASAAGAEVPNANHHSTDATLERFVGEWGMDLLAHKESFGERGGPGRGRMTCVRGLQNAWVDCVLDSQYEGLGDYALKIVLYKVGKDGSVGAFVTNSFGGGRLYLGSWQSANELVFLDAWIDPKKKWEYQTTSYIFHGPDSIEFSILVSHGGDTYRPHSSGVYTRTR